MGKLVRFIGRLLIITILLSSAIIKIKAPSKLQSSFTSGYNTFKNQHELLRENLPSPKEFTNYIPYLIRGIGAFQILTALSILFGDLLGGHLLLIRLVIGLLSTFSISQIMSKNMQLFPFLNNFVILIGISLCLAYRGPKQQMIKQ